MKNFKNWALYNNVRGECPAGKQEKKVQQNRELAIKQRNQI